MRNLKRVLSLALASAMLLGMMVMGAGAADTTTYADANSITNKEAVAVMSAIGTFQGADGKFNPTGVLTRESAAKIITYLVMGKAAADDLKTTSTGFTDVAADRWSAGSIAYCASQGIISGDGAGHFYPELTVNGYAFAKMLLGALGYKADVEKLVGTGWESNVSKLVNKLGLKNGISNALSKDMTREQAAQMAFNTLSAQTVSYSGGADINLGEGSINIGGTKDYGDTFMKENYPTLKSTPKTDDAGRPGNIWKLGATTVGTYGSTPDFTFTAATKKADLGLDGYAIENSGTTGVVPAANTDDTLAAVKTLDNLAALTKNGRAVEVYTKTIADVATITDIVVVDTYLYTIGSINTVSKTVSFKGSPAIDTVTNEDQAALYTALVDMGKDAKVLVTRDADGAVLTVAEPETIDGTYTAKSSNGDRTIGGTKYTDSYKLAVANFGSFGTSYTVYLDTYGYSIGAEEEAAATTKTAYIKAVDVQGSASTGRTYLAQVVFAEDGTQEWVEVAKLNNGTKDQSPDKYGSGLLSDWTSALPAGTVVSYSVKTDGTYVMSTLKSGGSYTGSISIDTAKDTYYSFPKTDIKKGEANFFNKTGDIQGSSKTIFLVEKDSKFTIYTGVKNVPNLNEAVGTVVVSKNTKTASLVVVTTAKNAIDSSSLAYVIKNTGAEYDETLKDTVYTFSAIVKGEVTTLKTTVMKDNGGTNDITKGLYNVSYDSNGNGVSLIPVAKGDNDLVKVAATATLVSGTITTTGDVASFVTADDFKVLVVDKNNKAAEITADDVAYYETKDQAGAFVILDSDKQFATTLIIVMKDAT